jgi:drug/metabolite transporter (DMT)-like permease
MSEAVLRPAGRSYAERSHLAGVMLLLASGLVASCGGPLFRAIETATAWQILFYRATGMLAVVGLYALARAGWRLREAFGPIGWRGVIAAACLAGASVSYITALTLTTVANTMFLIATGPLVSALLGRAFLGERVPRVTWVAMGFALCGIGLMVSDGLETGQLWGNLAGFGAGAGFAIFAVFLRGSALYGHGIHTNTALCCNALFGMAIGAAVACGQGDGLALSAVDSSFALGLGALQLGLALILFTIGARYLTAAEAMLLALVEVVCSPLWTWMVFGERPSDLGLLGGLVLLAGLVLQGAWGLRRRRAPPLPEVMP